ncbi:hypothetical protein CesoFtcFv8_000662 [Champsocephalus esox]|uniref:Uncharacterized protein n=1 Tax=Champsocephalus esox TaxID=159716 RepID=A0AAN8DC40_9TELE|nr:hypothetical protein CesoFtcFv8_000662 [Champsocephalus esox]
MSPILYLIRNFPGRFKAPWPLSGTAPRAATSKHQSFTAGPDRDTRSGTIQPYLERTGGATYRPTGSRALFTTRRKLLLETAHFEERNSAHSLSRGGFGRTEERVTRKNSTPWQSPTSPHCRGLFHSSHASTRTLMRSPSSTAACARKCTTCGCVGKR